MHRNMLDSISKSVEHTRGIGTELKYECKWLSCTLEALLAKDPTHERRSRSSSVDGTRVTSKLDLANRSRPQN